MKSAKRFLMVAAAFALATLTFTLANPKAVHAFAATLVQVTNTSANPVPMSDSATQYQAYLCLAFNNFGYDACSGAASTFTVPTTTSSGAAVKRLVIANFNGLCGANNKDTVLFNVFLQAPPIPDVFFNGGVDASGSMWHSASLTPTYTNPALGAGLTSYGFNQPTHWAFNPGDSVSLSLLYTTTNSAYPDYRCLAVAEGYFIT